MDSKNQNPAMDSRKQDPAVDSKNQAPANGELKDGELNAVTGGFGGNLATAVAKGLNTARDEYYLSQQH